MPTRANRKSGNKYRQRLALVAVILGLGGLLAIFGRDMPLPHAAAEPKEAAKETGTVEAAPAKQAVKAAPSDYSKRAVAYVHGTQVVTRADLGEYLIARLGAARVEFFVNKLIIERECLRLGISVTAAEIEAALQQDLKDLGNITLKEFESKFLKQYRKNLFEWKEDVIRSRLLMTKMCRSRVEVTPEDLQAAFAIRYGAKVEGRAIVFPPGQQKEAREVWEKVHDSEKEFVFHARQQPTNLAAQGGKIDPISRNSGSPELEREVFSLKPGEVSSIIPTPGGLVIFKCDRQVPANTKVKLESVRDELTSAIIDKKVQQEIPLVFQELRKKADPRVQLEPYETEEDWRADIGDGSDGMDYTSKAVAYIYGTQVITRAQLGEYLIARLGAERLEFLVNKLIIEQECESRGIAVTRAEVEADFKMELAKLNNISVKDFEEKVLKKHRKTLYEWKEDVVRSRLLMSRLSRDRVTVTNKDLQSAFEAHYGNRVQGRIIMLPGDQEKVAMKIWQKVRDSEEEFRNQARIQPSVSLAAKGGEVRPISRNSTGNPELEREVFSLRPGQVSKIIGTPHGLVIFKCDKILKSDSKVKLADVRADLEKEIKEKKVEAEIPRVFKELQQAAAPRIFLKRYTSQEDWLRDIRKELQAENDKARTPPRAN